MLLPNSYYHIHRIKHQILPGHVSFYIPIVARKSLGVCSPGPPTRTPLWPSGASNGGIGGKRCWETWPLHSCFLVVVFLYLNGVFEGSFGLRLRGQRWANYSKTAHMIHFNFPLADQSYIRLCHVNKRRLKQVPEVQKAFWTPIVISYPHTLNSGSSSWGDIIWLIFIMI